jgi:hypothetical protein
MTTVHNVNDSLSLGIEITNGLVVVLLVYGLLFCPSPFIVFLCIFLAVFGIFLGQVSHYCIVDHVQCTMTTAPETFPRNRFEILSDGVGKAVRLEPKAIYLVLLVMMHIVVLVGFYRLYTMLSKEKGFL